MTRPIEDRLTPRAQKILAVARSEARGLRMPAVGVDALLLAVAADDGIAGAALDALADRLRAQLAPEQPDDGPDLRLAVLEAARLADESGCGYVGAEHLLAACLSPATGQADRVQLLLSAGAHTDRAAVRVRLAGLLRRRGEQDADATLAGLLETTTDEGSTIREGDDDASAPRDC